MYVHVGDQARDLITASGDLCGRSSAAQRSPEVQRRAPERVCELRRGGGGWPIGLCLFGREGSVGD